jgi:4-hydroxybenzoate polyprenyltransferase
VKLKFLFFSLRPKQWVKNLLIFTPLIFGQQLFNMPLLIKACGAFVFFSLIASAMYVFNDLQDYHKDKLHRTKKLRPIASGKITRQEAWFLCFGLTLISLAGGFLIQLNLGMVIIFYLLLNLFYTRLLKEIVIVDVLSLGAFFVLRIIAGTVVAEVEFSYWMIIMVMLLATFLGFNKRRQEIKNAGSSLATEQRSVLNKYNLYFIDQMISVLTSSIVVVYMLYTIDERTVSEFGTRHLLWSTPFVYYGIFRYLYLVHKRRMGEDPTTTLLTDRMMQINILIWIGVCVFVIYFKP